MAQHIPIDPNTEPYRYLGFTQNSDGSVTRAPSDSALILVQPPSQDLENPFPALSKDLTFNQENQNWARLYVPKERSSGGGKLPLVVYFHGGGFVVGSPNFTPFHKFCAELTSRIPAVVASVKYRLAPEKRLPAAYDDAAEFVRWLDTAEDDWLGEYADLSKCFLMGMSAGGNLAYHLGLRCSKRVQNRIKIQGLILQQPFFGGVRRTPSETKLINDRILPLRIADILWDLALPIGADRDHEYCNFAAAQSYSGEVFERIKERKWMVMVTGCDGDPLVDRQRRLAEMLEGKGVNVVAEFAGGGCHGVELIDEARADLLYGLVKGFIHRSLSWCN